jgi:hypothetical protein
MQIEDLASLFCSSFEEDQVRTRVGSGSYIREEAVEALSLEIMAFIAEIVAIITDEGSERDAVMENEELRAAIEKELHGWTLH